VILRYYNFGAVIDELASRKAAPRRARVFRRKAMDKDYELLRRKIPARLDKQIIARAMADVVKAMLAAVEADQEDFWVTVNLDIHICSGKAMEKHARVNVYGDFRDPVEASSTQQINNNEVPSEVFRSFCEPAE